MLKANFKIGDGICQDHNNGPFCEYDGGDCCVTSINADVDELFQNCCICSIGFCLTAESWMPGMQHWT